MARPKARLSRTPALPPSAMATCASQCMSRCVRRAQGATSGASRSVKMRRGQRPLAQKNFRTLQVEHDAPWSPGEIRHRADITTMDTPRRKPADRTVDQGLRRRHLQRQLSGGVVHVPGIEVELGCREASGSKVSRITIASMDEKPLCFNQYTCWMAMKNRHQKRPRAHAS